jgi:hypothetical protein
LANVNEVAFPVELLKMLPKGRNMLGHIINLNIYIKLVYTGWLVIPYYVFYSMKESYEERGISLDCPFGFFTD